MSFSVILEVDFRMMTPLNSEGNHVEKTGVFSSGFLGYFLSQFDLCLLQFCLSP